MASVYRSAPLGASSGPRTEPPRLLDRLRFALRAKHYAYRTEQAYVHWVRRFILYHGKRHPERDGRAGNRGVPDAFGCGWPRFGQHANRRASKRGRSEY